MATYGLRPHPATIGPFGQFSTSPPPGQYLCFLDWGVHRQGLWPNPFDYGVKGPNGPKELFRTPMASMAHGPRFVDHGPQFMQPLGPFWPKSNEANRGQAGRPPASKARWVPNHKWANLSLFWPQYQQSQNGQKKPGPKIGHFKPLGFGNNQRPQDQVQKSFPSIQGNNSPSPMYSIPKDPGMVPIWYNIPLCTNLAQKSNVDVF
ncbi:hypothetical protein O181_129781 [Austropuccinia psidii MF-1]|uniref:Uncharacterized protein n=1 Tax=Austropuccinia psidii MF-1 TaxID=1389203 RepID=A0A9Q3L1H3_9BASI|nr:hypothetical protein [Austropuccinia psidii MF-1]